MIRLLTVFVASTFLLSSSALLAAEPASPQTFEVRAIGAPHSFADRYEFQAGEGLAFQQGDLCIGGVESPITVSRLIPETRTRKVTIYEVVVVSGRPRVVPVEKTIEYTVYRLVSEQITLTSPRIKGQWVALDLAQGSAWLFFAQEGSGIALGLGTTAGDQLQGAAFYLNFGQVPSGYYGLLGTKANGMMD